MSDVPPPDRDAILIEFLREQRRHLIAQAEACKRMIEMLQAGKVEQDRQAKPMP